MSGLLPVVSGRDVVKALGKAGYRQDRILRHETPPHRRVTVPDHPEIAKGTLRAIIRETGLTVSEFLHLLK